MLNTVSMISKSIHFRNVHKQRMLVLVFGAAIGALIAYRLWFQTEIVKETSEIHIVSNRGVGHKVAMSLQGKSLKFADREFQLRGKNVRLLSGAMHYFRSFPEQWEERMKKMKACGLNTLETYVAWNLHEETPGKFNFKGRLDLRKYIQLAHRMGLYVILRPGPYICSEWDFGGLPSWLLNDINMDVRSNYPLYRTAVDRYFKELIPQVVDLQYSAKGPIIAVQVENEFYSYSNETNHLLYLKDLLQKLGIVELLCTSDGGKGVARVNFQEYALPMPNMGDLSYGQTYIDVIRSYNKDFPIMVMEFWDGWFDHWGKQHKGQALNVFKKNVQDLLGMGASINFYMFHGGTNFGFMAGANWFPEKGYQADTTSYDYDCPLSEAGDTTDKYHALRKILLDVVYKPQGITDLPPVPPNSPKAKYGVIKMTEYMSWFDLLTHVKSIHLPKVVSMEMFKLGSGHGQNYGYAVYQKSLKTGQKMKFLGSVRDRAQVLVAGKEVETFDYKKHDHEVNLGLTGEEKLVDVIVENTARVNYGVYPDRVLNRQRKGIVDDVQLDGKVIDDWTVFALDFGDEIVKSLTSSAKWKPISVRSMEPTLYRTKLTITGEPKDTFLLLKGWSKGVVFINGFNIGRYWEIGPQKTLYVPAPVLKEKDNEIMIFEHNKSTGEIEFQDFAELGQKDARYT